VSIVSIMPNAPAVKVGATVTRMVVITYRSISTGTMHAGDIGSGGIV